jgi:AraC family transcriptional activator of tynA and feaB
MQTLFSFAGAANANIWSKLLELNSREFFEGDIDIDVQEGLKLTFEKAMNYPISLTHMILNAPIGNRRSWKHIVKNRVGVRVIFFVKRGSMQINLSHGSYEINVGQAVIQDSNVPFYAKLLCDDLSVHESFQVIIPSHLFFKHLSSAERLVNAIDLETANGHVVLQLLDILASEGDTLARKITEPLVGSLLEAIASVIHTQHIDLPQRETIVGKRLRDIEDYIVMHLADSELSHERVATACGISPRYLCHLLKVDNTSFAKTLWANRRKKARDLLISPQMRDRTIDEVAQMSGFKTTAHFCRMFKSAYQLTPREYRASHMTLDANALELDDAQRTTLTKSERAQHSPVWEGNHDLQ